MTARALRRDWRLWLILLLAFAVRLPLLRTGTVQADLALIGDEGNYVFNADAMLRGTLVQQDLLLPWMRAPLLPMLMAGAALITRTSPAVTVMPIVVVQIALSVLLVALTAHIAERIAGRRTALLAALGMAVLPAWVYYPALVLSETLFTLGLMWAVALVLRPPPARRWLHWMLLGGVLGLAALSRSTALAAVPLFWLGLWLKDRNWRTALRSGIGMAIGVLVVVAPWTLRNYVRYNGLILVDTTGAYTLWQDNTTLERAEVKAQVMAQPDPVARQAYASAAFRREIAADPSRFIGNVTARLGRALLPEPTTTYRNDWLRTYPDGAVAWAEVYAIGSTISYAVLLPLALLGTTLLWRERRHQPLGAVVVVLTALLTSLYLFQTATTHYSQRFLVPLFPLYVMLSSVALVHWRDGWRWLLHSWSGRGILALTLVFWIASWPYNRPTLALLRSDWHWMGGAACQDSADLEQLQRAVQTVPAPNWRLTTTLGRCLIAQGSTEQGIATLWQAVAQAETMEQPGADTHAALVLAYRDQGQLDQAQEAGLIATSGQMALLNWAWRDSPPPTSHIDVGELDAGYVRGFWGAERDADGRSYRWMSGDGILRFSGCSAGTHMLMLAVAGGHPADSPAILTINDTSVFELAATWRVVRVPIELGPDCTIDLHAQTWRPLEYDPTTADPRGLGLMLDWAEIGPQLPPP